MAFNNYLNRLTGWASGLILHTYRALNPLFTRDILYRFRAAPPFKYRLKEDLTFRVCRTAAVAIDIVINLQRSISPNHPSVVILVRCKAFECRPHCLGFISSVVLFGKFPQKLYG